MATATITLTEAQKHLDAWLEADSAISTGKRYKIGTRELTRAESAEIKERITYWRTEVARAKRGGGMRVRRVIARDL